MEIWYYSKKESNYRRCMDSKVSYILNICNSWISFEIVFFLHIWSEEWIKTTISYTTGLPSGLPIIDVDMLFYDTMILVKVLVYIWVQCVLYKLKKKQ